MDLLYLVYTWTVKYQVSHLQYWGLQGSSVSGIHLDSPVLGIPWIFCIWYTPGQSSIRYHIYNTGDYRDLLFLVYTWIVQYQGSHGSSVSGIHLDSSVLGIPWIFCIWYTPGQFSIRYHMDLQYLVYTWIVQYIGIPWIFSIWYTPGQSSI